MATVIPNIKTYKLYLTKRFAGRADYLVLHDNGDVDAWRNSGVQLYVEYWQHLGIVSSGKTFEDLIGVRFVDVSSDVKVAIYRSSG